ncbi:MAG: hypothetical protein ACRBEE_07785 [Arenicella sp.]
MEQSTLFVVSQSSSGGLTLTQESSSNVGSFPTASSVSCSFEYQKSSYSAFYNAAKTRVEIYENTAKTGHFFVQKNNTSVTDAIDFLDAFTLGGNVYFSAYSTSGEYINFYALQGDLSLTKVYGGYIGSGYTMIKPLEYRNSVFFLAYNHTKGSVSKYQIMATSQHPIYINETWSDTWAKQWMRFAFFQFGGENFFIKTNMLHKKVNIDHLMDDLIEGSHPVLNEAAPSYMQTAVDVKTFSDNDGNAFFAVAQPGGDISVNQVHPNCLGWTEQCSASLTAASSMLPYQVEGKQYLLVN